MRRDTGEGYNEMLRRMAKESGVETPTQDDLIRMDRQRKGKKLSNHDWKSPTDPEARIAKMKDGRTRLGYKPEHAVDLDTGAIVAAKALDTASEQLAARCATRATFPAIPSKNLMAVSGRRVSPSPNARA